MDSALYSAYSGLRSTSDMLDVLSNNLANVNTAGFKTDEVFLRIYNHAVAAGDAGALDRVVNDSSVVRGSVSTFLPGPIRPTGRDLDIALESDGFFVVQGPAGAYYTRNGNMYADANGAVTNSEGFALVGENGPIQLPPGQVVISPDGEIQVNGNTVDRLKIVAFGDNRSLEKVGNSAFRVNGPEGVALEPGRVNVRQGSLEQSNVNPVKEMVLMISIMRQFEALQKTISTIMNTVNEQSISQVGRIVG